MASAWLSILGLYQYDNSIFDELTLPPGIDKDLVINNILYDNAELGLLYVDGDIIKAMIGIWSNSEFDIWHRLNKAFNEEYNPIWNVDEDTTETRNIEKEGSDTRNDNRNIDSSANSEGTSNTINKTTGYNATTLENDNSSDNTSTSEGSSNTTENLVSRGSNQENVLEVFKRKRGGNIGVTMSQQLLEAELETRPKLNIYKYISNSFKERFCLMIY